MISRKEPYIFLLTPHHMMLWNIEGEIPELLYYGKKKSLSTDWSAYKGTTNRTGVDLRNYMFSQFGGEDYREAYCEIANGNHNEISNFVFKGYRILKEVKFDSPLPFSRNKESIICFDFEDQINQMQLEIYYATFKDVDVISSFSRLINHHDASIFIHRLSSLELDLHAESFKIYTFDGEWARERSRHESLLTCGVFKNQSRTGSSSALHHPLTIVETNEGFYSVNLIYSSNHLTTIELDDYQRGRILTGMNDFMLSYEVKKDEEFLSPEAILTFAKNESELISTHHTFVQKHIVYKEYENAPRPILMNNWEGTYFDFTKDKILEMAKTAKDLGIELFVLDDGWFGHRDNDASSLGDWFDYSSKTGGLASLAKEIHQLGLKFGIWMEPEMISEDSDLFKEHPEYAMKIPHRTPHLHRNQMMLDLANEEVKEFVLDSIRNVLHLTKADYMKWDYNRNFSDVYSTSCPVGEYFHRYILNLYSIFQTIHEEFPHVLIEGCAAGGSRFDLGILFYMPQIWTSDNTDPYDRIRIQTGTSYGYSQASMGAHVSASPNGFTERKSSLETRFNVACGGNLGYELDPTKFTKEEKEKVKAQIAFYKENRILFQFAKTQYFTSYYQNGIGGFITYDEKQKHGFMVITSSTLSPKGQLKIPLLSTKKEYLLKGRDIPYEQVLKGNRITNLSEIFSHIEDQNEEYALYSVMLEIKEY